MALSSVHWHLWLLPKAICIPCILNSCMRHNSNNMISIAWVMQIIILRLLIVIPLVVVVVVIIIVAVVVIAVMHVCSI